MRNVKYRFSSRLFCCSLKATIKFSHCRTLTLIDNTREKHRKIPGMRFSHVPVLFSYAQNIAVPITDVPKDRMHTIRV